MDEMKTGKTANFPVQVCYALPDMQILLDLEVEEGTSIEQAIRQSGILERIPEIDLSVNQVGIFGKARTLGTSLRANDRIEIYRPLHADPKEARRRRTTENTVRHARSS